jgi:tetratricopeptide (TPR) repeat protein
LLRDEEVVGSNPATPTAETADQAGTGSSTRLICFCLPAICHTAPHDLPHARYRRIPGCARAVGAFRANTLTSRSNLAISYSDSGRAREALELREQVLADRERLLGPDHPDTLTSRSNLADSYRAAGLADSDRAAGRMDEAVALDEGVLADRERVLGPDHPDTVRARSSLADSYSNAGRIQEALELRERVLADRERLLGPHHPDTIRARANLADSYSDAGRIQEALELDEQVVAVRELLRKLSEQRRTKRERPGPDHPDPPRPQ